MKVQPRLFIFVSLLFASLFFSGNAEATCFYQVYINGVADGSCSGGTPVTVSGSCAGVGLGLPASVVATIGGLTSGGASCPATSAPPSCTLTGAAPPITVGFGVGVTPSTTSVAAYGNSNCAVNVSSAKMVCVPDTASGAGFQTCTYSGGTYQNANTSDSASTPVAPSTSSLLPGASNGTNGTPPANSSACAAGYGFAQINNMTGCLPPGSTQTNTSQQTSNGTAGASTTTQNTVGGGTSTTISAPSVNADGQAITQTDTTSSSNGGGGSNGTSTSNNQNLFDNTPLTFDSSAIPSTGNNPSVVFTNPAAFAVTAFIPGDVQGGCPFIDQNLTIMHTAVSLPFSQWCSFTSWMYPLMSALAYFGGFMMLSAM